MSSVYLYFFRNYLYNFTGQVILTFPEKSPVVIKWINSIT